MRNFTFIFTVTALIVGTLWISDSFAFDESVSLSQAADGSITATLSGMRYPCTYGFNGVPIVTISGNQITLNSPAVGMGCPTLPGDVPFAFTQSTSLAVLPDGAYTLRWSQTDAVPTFQVQLQFFINLGLLSLSNPAPIPTLSPWSIAVLVLLMFVGLLGRGFPNPAVNRTCAKSRAGRLL